MDDLVKRSDVFEAFSDVLDDDFPYKSEETPRERIESIPSAQPNVPNANVGGMINRQDAIDALGERPIAWMQDEYETGLQNQYDSDLAALQSVPSVQSDIYNRAEGAWVLNHLTQLWECINCHEQEEKITDFCPHCGARITEVIQF